MFYAIETLWDSTPRNRQINPETIFVTDVKAVYKERASDFEATKRVTWCPAEEMRWLRQIMKSIFYR